MAISAFQLACPVLAQAPELGLRNDHPPTCTSLFTEHFPMNGENVPVRRATVTLFLRKYTGHNFPYNERRTRVLCTQTHAIEAHIRMFLRRNERSILRGGSILDYGSPGAAGWVSIDLR